MQAWLKKNFWIVYVFFLVTTAYFTANGTANLAAAEIEDALAQNLPEDSGADSLARRRAARLSRKPRFEAPDGDPILERNLFDSETGPIDPDFQEKIAEQFEEVLEDNEDRGPLPLVPCGASKVKLLATVADPENQAWSFASIEEGREAALCRVGDVVDDRTVVAISWRYLFLEGSSNICYLDMFSDQSVKTKRKPRRSAKARRPSKNDKFKDGIQVVSATERIVDRSLIHEVVRNPAQIIRSVRVRPHRKNGKVVGYKIRRIKKNSPLAMLGAKRGDVIHSVNGKSLSSVNQALQVYQSMGREDDFTFSITRRGKPVKMKVQIR